MAPVTGNQGSGSALTNQAHTQSLADQLVDDTSDMDLLAAAIVKHKGQMSQHDYEDLKGRVESKLKPFDAGHLTRALTNLESAQGGPQPAPDLGYLSRKGESKSAPHPETVSTGKGDAGGASYGAYQIKTDNVPDFLRHEGSQWSDELRDKPGTLEFGKAWTAVAKRDPQGFMAAQQSYIERANYKPALKDIKKATGIDVSKQSTTLQQVVFSTAVQSGSGGSARIVTQAITDAEDRGYQPTDPDFERVVTVRIYDERARVFQDDDERRGELKQFFLE